MKTKNSFKIHPVALWFNISGQESSVADILFQNKKARWL